MRLPTQALQARFDVLSPEKKVQALTLLENGLAVIDQLGTTPLILRHAWEAILERVEATEGDLR